MHGSMRTAAAVLTVAVLGACAPAALAAKGDWRQAYVDARGSASNPDETLITPASASSLQPVWSDVRLHGSHPVTGPLPTGAAVAGKNLYAGWNDGSVERRALADGSVRWTVQLATTCVGAHGLAPIVQGRLLVVGCGDSVYGLSTRDGHELWHVTRAGLSATGLTLGGADVYVSWSNAAGDAGQVSALDAAGGAPAWEQPTASAPPPVAVARKLALYTDGLTLVARDAATGVQRFTLPFASSRVSVAAGIAYDAHGGRADLRTGQLLSPLTLLSQGADQPPAIDGGTLFYGITSLSHVVQSLAAGTGAEDWHAAYQSSEELPTGPSVAGGVVWLVGTTGLLQGFDEATGAPLLSLATKPPFEGFAFSQPPIVSHGFLVLTAYGLQAFSVPRA